MKYTKSILCLLVGMLFFFSCKKDKVSPYDNVDVYAAGYETNAAGIEIATYWKNGNHVALTNGSLNARAFSIAVSGNDIYVLGYESLYGFNVPTYWKNGEAVRLATQSDADKSVYATSITVMGNDVYVSGGSLNADLVMVARYWKNGIPVALSNGDINEYANSVVTSGSDVFIAGQADVQRSIENLNTIGVAKYWKNGLPVILTDSIDSLGAQPREDTFFITKSGRALNIAVAGTDVYVAGYELVSDSLKLKYWKNGIPVRIAAGISTNINAAITVSGNDVYITGADLTYYKNGNPVSLAIQSSVGSLFQICTSDNDVFIGGTQNGRPSIWKNDVEILHDGILGQIFDIKVVKH